MADYTLNTSNLTQCGGNELSSSLYTAVYAKLVSQNSSNGTSVIHIQIALWASYASGGSTRTWSGAWVMYGPNESSNLASGTYSGTYSNYTSPVWVVNTDVTVSHGRSGTTWTQLKSFGVNVQCNTQNNGSVTHGHRNWTPNSGTNWYTNAIIPAFSTATRTVTLNQNGGSGGTTSVSIKYGTAAGSYPSITRPTRTGYTFNGYYTATSGGTQYYNSAGNSVREFNINSNTTWYAQWSTINGTYYYHRGTAYDNQSGQLYGTAKSGYTLVTALSQTGMAGNSSSQVITGTWNIGSTGVDVYNSTTLFNAPTGASHAAESKQWKVWNHTRGKWLNTTGMSAASLNFNSLVGNNGTTYGDTLVLFVNWQRNSYTLTTAVSPSGGGTVTGGGTYAYQASYTITATAASGYRFTGWTYSNGWSGSNSNATVTGTMPATNGTATANFVQIFYLDVNGHLDGAVVGNTSGYGTFDVTVGGTLRANDVADHYAQYDKGSSYSISDIKATTGHVYLGVVAGAASGTINAATSIQLSFYSQTVWIYVGGAWHRAIPWVYHGGSWHRSLAKVYSGGWKNGKT